MKRNDRYTGAQPWREATDLRIGRPALPTNETSPDTPKTIPRDLSLTYCPRDAMIGNVSHFIESSDRDFELFGPHRWPIFVPS